MPTGPLAYQPQKRFRTHANKQPFAPQRPSGELGGGATMISALSTPLDSHQAPPLPPADIINITNNFKNLCGQQPLGPTGPSTIAIDVTTVCLVRRPNHRVHVSLGLTHKAMILTIAVLETRYGSRLTPYEALSGPRRAFVSAQRDPGSCAATGILSTRAEN